ncbi:hypothetical protein [Halobacteriovorax sp. RT-1-4]|uniref:hypothetical protein n=1 Tax=unclassified Halobacteriovorax TaxID=2639665 RepID=UPI00399A24FE
MKLNLKNTLLSVIVLASLVGCGSDGGSGSSNYNNTINGGNTNGIAGSLVTAQQLANAISNNNFGQSSPAGLYPFRKANSNNSSYECKDKWYGTICTSSTSTSGYDNDDIGFRELDSNGNINRNVNYYGTQYTYSEDAHFGSSLNSLASNLASYVMNANNNGGLYKVDNYGRYYKYSDNMNCNQYYSLGYTSYSECQTVKSANTRRWIVAVNGVLHAIDMNQSLIQQPISRQANNVGITAY